MKLICITAISAAVLFAAKPQVHVGKPLLRAAKPRVSAGRPHVKLEPRDVILAANDTVPIMILGGEWTTTIIFNNTDDVPEDFSVTFYNPDGEWVLPVVDVGDTSSLDVSLPARGTLKIQFDYHASSPSLGYALASIQCPTLDSCPGIVGYAFLRNHNALRAQDFEVTYPLGQSTVSSLQHFLFDQDNFAQMVVNLTNTCVFDGCDAAAVAIDVYDENGDRFFIHDETVGQGETKILNFAQMSSTTWNRVGVIRISSSIDGVVVSGHRINETGSFTPLLPYFY